jgi:hypothetical protein
MDPNQNNNNNAGAPPKKDFLDKGKQTKTPFTPATTPAH